MIHNLDFRNVNTLWASVLVETLYRLGLTKTIISPGSRSTPLTLAFAKHPHIETIPILDERSAAFFALGLAKQLKIPIALVCTSGTAAANFYPAIIEATLSNTPMLVLTADRPGSLRDCHAGQTINQINLYNHYPNWQTELSQPSSDFELLKYLRQTCIQAWENSLYPTPGVVHLNIPFSEPLAPIPDLKTENLKEQYNFSNFFQHITNFFVSNSCSLSSAIYPILDEWLSFEKGLIIVGSGSPDSPSNYCQAIAYLSQLLKYPILADALSPLRNYASLNPYLISTYDLILRNSNLAQNLAPSLIIQIGELPTSKELRSWLNIYECKRFVIGISTDNFDPLHGKTIHIRISIEQFINNLKDNFFTYVNNYKKLRESMPSNEEEGLLSKSNYTDIWLKIDVIITQKIYQQMAIIDSLFEGKVAWILSQRLPDKTAVFIANSMSVRYAEFFWTKNDKNYQIYFNRGANGIDGTLSTALGVAHEQKNTILLTGDLALLHDTNGFLASQNWQGNLTIVLINNQGGGIFETLPIVQTEEEFEKYFVTPQNIDFAKLCDTYKVKYYCIKNWKELVQLISNTAPEAIRLIEVPTNRQIDAVWIQKNLSKFAQNIK